MLLIHIHTYLLNLQSQDQEGQKGMKERKNDRMKEKTRLITMF